MPILIICFFGNQVAKEKSINCKREKEKKKPELTNQQLGPLRAPFRSAFFETRKLDEKKLTDSSQFPELFKNHSAISDVNSWFDFPQDEHVL